MKILIIDDNESLATMLCDLLENEGFLSSYYTSLDDIEDYLSLNKYDLILLDIMLDNDDGISFLKSIRNDIFRPVIFLTAKNAKGDVLLGLSSGGDDYITKPFDNDILIEKIKSHIRRDNHNKENILEINGIKFDLRTNKVFVSGQYVHLTASEFEILLLLAKNPNKVFTKEELLFYMHEEIDATTEKIVVQHIYKIRKKFSVINLEVIESIWGIGYKWKRI